MEGSERGIGAKAQAVLTKAALLGSPLGRPFDPAVVFILALAVIDEPGVIVSKRVRDGALQRALKVSDDDSSAQDLFSDFVQAAFAEASARAHTVVYPIDLMRAGLAVASSRIAAAFGSVDVQRAFPFADIEDRIPAEVLRDDLPTEAAPLNRRAPTQPRYEVVVRGTDFCDRRNRYATLEEARTAANALSVRAFGEPKFTFSESDPLPDGCLVRVPHRLSEAISIDVKEL